MPGPPRVIKAKQDWIAAIDTEIANLQQARHLLAGTTATPKKKRRTLSAEARARISAAQKKRWAQQKKAAKR